MKNDFFALINSFFKKLHLLSEEQKDLNYGKKEQEDESDFSTS